VIFVPKGVACSVSNCSFWDQGNRCGAEEIAIEIDSHSSIHLGEEFGGGLGEHQDSASASSVTCCLTFVPKAENRSSGRG
jgi:hypothetical protein